MQQYISGEVVVYSAKCEEQKEFEWNLPEYLPGISRIAKSDVTIDKCIFSNDDKNAFVDLAMKVKILYVSDHEGKLKSAVFDQKQTVSFKEPFGIDGEFTAIPSCYLSTVQARAVTGRKISVGFILTCGVTVLKGQETPIYDAGDNEGICTLKKELDVCSRITLPETHFEHRASITLDSSKPPIGEIVYSKAAFSKNKANALDGFVDFEANLEIFVLYEVGGDDGDGDVSYASFVFPVTLKNSLSDSRINDSYMPYLYIDSGSAEPSVSFDSFGENKEVSFDINYSVSGFLSKNEKKEIVADAFCEHSQSHAEMTSLSFDRIKNTVNKSETIRETARCDMSGLQEISDCLASIRSVSFEQSESSLFAATRCMVEVFGTNASGELICVDCPVTLHVPIEDSSVFNAETFPDIILSITSCKSEISAGNLVCTVEFCTKGIICEKSSCDAVKNLEVSETQISQTPDSEIIVFYPSAGDGIWDIAKKYRRSPLSIRQANNIDGDDISSKHFLLIP